VTDVGDLVGRKARALAACGGLPALLVEEHVPEAGLCPRCTEAYETAVAWPCEVRDLAERALYHQAAAQQRRAGARGIALFGATPLAHLTSAKVTVIRPNPSELVSAVSICRVFSSARVRSSLCWAASSSFWVASR
jgi:hypothetical protein